MATPDLVTLEQLKDALRIETEESNTTLGLYIKAASSAVLEYLKPAVTETFIVEGALVEADMPEQVRIATIMYVKLFNDGFTKDDFPDPTRPPPIVQALLYGLRTPTCA